MSQPLKTETLGELSVQDLGQWMHVLSGEGTEPLASGLLERFEARYSGIHRVVSVTLRSYDARCIELEDYLEQHPIRIDRSH